MYLPIGGSLATPAKLGPQAKTFSCSSVSGVLERLCTHFLVWVRSCLGIDVAVSGFVSVLSNVDASLVSSDQSYPSLPCW